jgi:hypothetical protein
MQHHGIPVAPLELAGNVPCDVVVHLGEVLQTVSRVLPL